MTDQPNLFGLVLAGGRSVRMGRDKGSIVYHGVDQRSYCHQLLTPYCQKVFISCRKDQSSLLSPGQLPVFDLEKDLGPAGGLLSAHQFNPSVSWIVLAC